MSEFRVSLGPFGEPHWWVGGAHIPKDHTEIRPASPSEAFLMDRICNGGWTAVDHGALIKLLHKRAPP